MNLLGEAKNRLNPEEEKERKILREEMGDID